ncbi:ATPase, T2SS/T4P/T4SS family [Natronomonas sp. EA1]|uniref:ATPase, T2SS/T4P/T4SS family n=1 Tax=Natronomonas sp. EA1 TaxID=3421655 RepID=UPI003EBED3A6
MFTDPDCTCEPRFEGETLRVESDGCPGGGALASEPACRETVVAVLEARDADRVLIRHRGVERAYEDAAAALLTAAGRFADAARFHDEVLADRARREPLRAARDATGRAGPLAELAAETGLALLADRAAGYDEALRPYEGPAVARERVATTPPPDARLRDRTDLDTGATVRLYERDAPHRLYHLTPEEAGFEPAAYETLARAYERLAAGSGGERAPARAARAVATDDPERIARVLTKHTRGLGVLDDILADPRVSDVFATAPVAESPLRVRVDGEAMVTNVRLTDDGAAALASRFRRESGRGFSRATPTLDAALDVGGRRVRVAGVTDPASDGHAFVFRAADRAGFSLPELVANGTLAAREAGFLSVAVERGAAVLLAGGRGAGKTTALGALLRALPARTRTVVIEDTPELPVAALRSDGRDVQRLHVTRDDGPGLAPAEALRTALRLGDGALAVGEVRGEEASALYEAMRVGASEAVLGTVHGDGAGAVRERVVSDLGVPESAFCDTDLVVTLESGPKGRRVAAIEEVVGREEATFATLFADGPTGRIDRGNSHAVAGFARADETYADVRATIDDRTRAFE